ncbi:2-methylcitrate dehydratase [Nitrospira sp. KM1]|uniref:MmgE/PrpD family protein n=1 Tax=Nitrospira sp. KM1 TaxID=1936990 RepID=UPI0013A79A19|nr:MmgE/PrpD family protein [Nitrospira sp. KM1]BCA53352.1 2-methylcitrate dehydratase [Nitrospira sp. KM1]
MLAARLARYCRSLRYERLSDAVIHEVKRRVLDSLGCALGAWSAPPCRIARHLAQRVTITTGATLWGTAHKTLPDLATFANGALVRYLDFNDTYLAKEPAHPSDNIPAVLAIGEAVHASGRRVIEAIALAYEIQCRFCDAAALRPRGWDHVTYGSFSSALAAAKILQFSNAQAFHAVNLAGVANVALRQTRVGDLSMWKACAFSNAARNGIFAAMLAKHGMTGPSPIFEGEKGFMKLVSGLFDLSPFGGDDGESTSSGSDSFRILDTYIKRYPVEYHAQSAVEAALELRSDLIQAEGDQAVEHVSDIEVGSYDVAIEIIGRDPEKWQPSTRETADHSFPYCVAVALLDGRVSLRSFGRKRLQDGTLRELMKRVRVVRLPELADCYPKTMPTRITVRTRAGKTYTRQKDIPLGHPANPMSDRELEAKFRRLVSGRLGRARIDRLIQLVWTLERLKDIGMLMPLLRINARS